MTIPFVPAKWFTPGPRHGPIELIVIHDMEFPEKITAAEDIAAYFKRGRKKASAHYCVDSNSIVQCVRDTDIAYHAPGANHNGIGIEHAGYAKQTTDDWLDSYGVTMLRAQSAPLVRGLCETYGIPKRWLGVDQVVAGQRGITSHWNVSLAFGRSTHTDPGGQFPVTQYIDWVNDIPAPPQEDDMPKYVYSIKGAPERGEFLTDGITSRTLTGPALTHGRNRGWYVDADPKEMDLDEHDWLVENTKGNNVP